MWYTAAVPSTRPRRIVRRAVMVLAVVVLLPVGYVWSVCGYAFVSQTNLLPRSVIEHPIVWAYVSPLVSYSKSDLPGAKVCDDLIVLSWHAGQQFSRD